MAWGGAGSTGVITASGLPSGAGWDAGRQQWSYLTVGANGYVTTAWMSAPAPSSPTAIGASTGVNPTETSYSLYGHSVPLLVIGKARIGSEIISGPWLENGKGSAIFSCGVEADPSRTRTLVELAFDSEVVWTLAGGFTVEPFTFRFISGTMSQPADALEIAHFGANAVAYRPQILIAIENLPLANTKFGKIPYVSGVILDSGGEDINFGEAFERLAYSPWVGWTTAQFETLGITDGVPNGGLIIAQDAEFLSLIQQFGRFYPTWDILQTDKLRIVDRSTVASDITLDATRLMDKVIISRQGSDTIKKELELSTIDPDADYTIVPSVASRPRFPVAVTTSVGRDSAYLPVIMDSSTRQAIVTLAKYHEEATRKTISFTAMAYGLEIEPGALVRISNLDDDFNNETFKVRETLHGANYVVECTATAILRCTIGDDVDANVTVVATSGTTYTTSTNQDQTVPSEAAIGDLLIAAVMHRATLTPPVGWTLVASASCTGTAIPGTQMTSVYKRTAQSGDAGSSTTWTQGSSQRIAVHIVVLRNSGGCDVVDFDTASQSHDVTASNTAVMAESTATANGQMGLAFASSILASAVLFTATGMQASAGWTQTTPLNVEANRLGAAYRSRSASEITSGTFTNDLPGTLNNGWACVSLIIG